MCCDMLTMQGIIQRGLLHLQAFATLQRLVGPTLDYFMNRTGSKSAGNEAVGQMARELKGYLSRAIQS